jgi:hypothetical protein
MREDVSAEVVGRYSKQPLHPRIGHSLELCYNATSHCKPFFSISTDISATTPHLTLLIKEWPR